LDMDNLNLQPPVAQAGILRINLHHELTDRLREMIVEGRLEAGVKVPEKDLCLQMGVSRTPLRESLKVLAAEGMVALTPNRGASVSPLTRQEVVDVFPILGALEGLAGSLAGPRIEEAGLEVLRTLQNQMAKNYEKGDLSAYFKCNQAVHQTILKAAGNEALLSTHNSLSGRMRRYRYAANLSRKRWREAIEEHQSILEALVARNANKVSFLLQEHFRHKLVAALRQIDRETPAPPPA